MRRNILILTILLILFPLFPRAEEQGASLSRDEALRIAIANNLDIKLARIDAQYTRNDLGIANSVFDTILSAEIGHEDDQLARTSSLYGTKTVTNNYDVGLSKKLPSGTDVELDFDNTRSHTDSTYTSLNPAHTSQMKLTLTQPIAKNFLGLIDRGEVALTRLDIEKTDLSSLERIEKSLAGAEIDYWNLAYREAVVELKGEMLARAEELHQRYEERLFRGTAEAADLFASEANVKMRQLALKEAENEVLSCANTLTLGLNLDYKESLKTSSPLESLVQRADFITNLKTAIDSRRDYQRTRKDIEARDITVAMKKNSRWPEIDLVASFARNGVNTGGSGAVDEVFNEDNPELYLGMNLSIPLENRRARSEYKQALLLKERVLVEIKKLEMEIVRELDDKVRELNLGAEKVNKWKVIVGLQEAKLTEEEKRIMQGRSSSDILIRFQDDFLDAQLNLARAYLDYRTAKINLDLAKNVILTDLKEETILNNGVGR